MAAGRILVVDDDPATVLLCSRVLQKAGYAITIARDAGQAVAEATAVNRPSSSRTS
jgi:CheY-like chemotaxis protein